MSLFGGEESLNIIVRLQDEASKELQAMQSKFKQFGSGMQQAVGASQAFAAGLLGVGAAIGGLGYKMLQSAADAEQTKIAFTTMLGSVEKATEFTKELTKFAASTPFELKGLETASKQLLAYGFEQKQVLPNLKALGDIAAGVGMDKLPQLILAFGQVKAATRLTGNELRQFTEAGVPMLDQLATMMNKPVAEIQKMVETGQIGFPLVQQALQGLTGEGGRFNDLMNKQAQSLGGMVSNLSDAWEAFLRNEGAVFIDFAKQLVGALTVFIQTTLPDMIRMIRELSIAFQENQIAIGIIAGAIVGALVPAAWAATVAFGAWAVALAPFLLGGALIGGAIAGILLVAKNWDYVVLQFKSAVELLALYWKMLWDGFQKVVTDIWDAIKTSITSTINWIIDKINVLINAMNSVSSMSAGLFGASNSSIVIPNIPKLAEGGIVSSPTIAMIGEAGPEAVVPLSKMGNMGGGGATIVINYPSFKDQNDEDRMRTMLDQYFRPLLMNNKI